MLLSIGVRANGGRHRAVAITIQAAFGLRKGPYVWRCTDCAMHGAATRGTEAIVEAHAHMSFHARTSMDRSTRQLVEAS